MPLSKDIFMTACARNNIPTKKAEMLFKYASDMGYYSTKEQAKAKAKAKAKARQKKEAKKAALRCGNNYKEDKRKRKKGPKVETVRYSHEKAGQMAYGVGFQDAMKMFEICRKASEE